MTREEFEAYVASLPASLPYKHLKNAECRSCGGYIRRLVPPSLKDEDLTGCGCDEEPA